MKLTLVLTLFVWSVTLYGQNERSTQAEKQIKSVKIDVSEACDTAKSFWAVQDLPEYAGGDKKLIDDLNHLVTIDEELSGKCSISFLINCEGKASGFVLIKGDTTKDINDKIIESLAKLQNWKPGKLNDEKVDCTYTLKFAVKNRCLVLEN